MYLLDTNVVSELRRIKPHGGVVNWIRSIDDSALFISAVTLAEIQAGIEITKEQDPAKAREIETWLDQVADTFQVLPMDGGVFRRWAQLMHRASDTLYEDAMIAATAAAVIFSQFVRPQHSPGKTIAPALDELDDPVDKHDIGADAVDHRLVLRL